MIKQILFLIISTPFMAMSQVGVGTNNVDPSAKLQIESTNRGFLQPRIALTGTNDVATIASPAAGLMVYNTATAGSGATAITPGVHYFDGTKWVRTESSVINAGAGTTVTGNGTNANPYVVNSTGGGGTAATFVSGLFKDNGPDLGDGGEIRIVGLNASNYHGNSLGIGSITLPPGKWEVNLQVETWMRNSGVLGNATCRVKMQFWIQNDATINRILYSSGSQGDIGKIWNMATQTAENFPTVGFTDNLLTGSAAFTTTLNTVTTAVNDTYCKGSFLINNTSNVDKTYYIFGAELFDGCTPSSGNMPTYHYIKNRQYPSNRLYATKIN